MRPGDLVRTADEQVDWKAGRSNDDRSKPCACTSDAACLVHYGELDGRNQMMQRVQTGVQAKGRRPDPGAGLYDERSAGYSRRDARPVEDVQLGRR